MPTKPVDTFSHATDANFTSGPASGSPTTAALADPAQGFIPGTGVAAETANLPLNICGQWISDWLSLGSNAADLDAHIIETGASGDASISVISAGGTAATSGAITAVENSGATATTILGANSSGGVGVAALASGGGVGMSADVFDTCDGVIGQVRGSGAGVTGRVLTGLGTGTAIKGEGSVIGGPAMDLEFDATNPARGLIALQSTDVPSAPTAGDVWRRPDEPAALFDRRGGIEFQDDLGAPSKAGPGKLRVWSTPEGLEIVFEENLGFVQESAQVITDVVTATIPASAPNGKYLIRFTSEVQGFNAGSGSSDQAYFNLSISGSPVLEMAVSIPPTRLSMPITGGPQIVSGQWIYDKSSIVTAVNIATRIATAPAVSGSGEGVQASQSSISIVGVFD